MLLRGCLVRWMWLSPYSLYHQLLTQLPNIPLPLAGLRLPLSQAAGSRTVSYLQAPEGCLPSLLIRVPVRYRSRRGQTFNEVPTWWLRRLLLTSSPPLFSVLIGRGSVRILLVQRRISPAEQCQKGTAWGGGKGLSVVEKEDMVAASWWQLCGALIARAEHCGQRSHTPGPFSRLQSKWAARPD